MTIQNESIEYFKDTGYVLLKDVIPSKALQDVKTELHRLITHPSQPKQPLAQDILQNDSKSHQLTYNAMVTVGSSLSAYKLVSASQIDSYAAMVQFGTAQALHITPLHVDIQLPRDGTFDWEWHSEDQYYPWAPEILNVWFPILSSTIKDKTGTIGLLPQSHKRAQVHSKRTLKGNVRIECAVSKAEEREEVQIEADPGDMLLFHRRLIHRTCPNLSNVPRVTGILRVIDQSAMKESRVLYKAVSYIS